MGVKSQRSRKEFDHRDQIPERVLSRRKIEYQPLEMTESNGWEMEGLRVCLPTSTSSESTEILPDSQWQLSFPSRRVFQER